MQRNILILALAPVILSIPYTLALAGTGQQIDSDSPVLDAPYTSWENHEQTDPKDGTRIISISKKGRTTGFGMPRTAPTEITFACSSTNEPMILVQTGLVIDPKHVNLHLMVAVGVRVDKGQTYKERWGVLPGGTVLMNVLQDTALSFYRDLRGAKKVIFFFYSNGLEQASIFRLDGLEEAIKPLANICGWGK